MGIFYSMYISGRQWVDPDTYPNHYIASDIDPNYGFAELRKPREVKATYEEIVQARIPGRLQDYCVDYFLKLQKCRRMNSPFYSRCSHEKHEHHKCEYEDHIIRMKEYERERRLIERAKKKKLKLGGEENLE